jgi:hypothetical protein
VVVAFEHSKNSFWLEQWRRDFLKFCQQLIKRQVKAQKCYRAGQGVFQLHLNALQFERQALCLLNDNRDKDDEDCHQYSQKKTIDQRCRQIMAQFRAACDQRHRRIKYICQQGSNNQWPNERSNSEQQPGQACENDDQYQIAGGSTPAFIHDCFSFQVCQDRACSSARTLPAAWFKLPIMISLEPPSLRDPSYHFGAWRASAGRMISA